MKRQTCFNIKTFVNVYCIKLCIKNAKESDMLQRYGHDSWTNN